MEILKMEMGPLKTNSYLISHGSECIVIDPGFPRESRVLADYIIERGLKVKYIIATHGHFDHVLGINILRDALDHKPIFYIHIEDINLLARAGEILQDFFNIYVEPPKPDKYLYGGEVISIDGLSFKVIHTPGHTMGSICIYVLDENTLFTGDTLFKGSIGRFDFPESNADLLRKSLEKIIGMNPDTKIYPGHGDESTIKEEIVSNAPLHEILGM